MTQLMPVHDPLLSLWQSSVLSHRQEANREARFMLSSEYNDDPLLLGLVGHTYAHQHDGEEVSPEAPLMQTLGRAETPRDLSPAQVQTRYSEYTFKLARAEAFGRDEEYRHVNALLGSIVTKYGQYDIGWRECWAKWKQFFTAALLPMYRSWRDQNDGLRFGVIDWQLPAHGRVLLIGDWGTGQRDALEVLLAARTIADQGRAVDAVIHLGDVYYSGTREEYEEHYRKLLHRSDTFLGTPVFGLAGNHEYYCGGEGFYDVALAMNDSLSTSMRQSASYFCLRSECGTWQFLAMDTGYNDHCASLWQMGWNALQHLEVQPALRPDELRWHWDKLDDPSFVGSTVLLSHHQLMSAAAPWKRWPKDNLHDGVNRNLFEAFSDRLASSSNGSPDPSRRVVAWFWGHEHNLLFFKPDIWSVGRDKGQRREGPRFPRCLGNGSIPVWKSDDPYAQVNGNVDFIDNWPKYKLGTTSTSYPPFGFKGDLYNKGFALLDLNGPKKPMEVSYYQVPRDTPEKPALVYRESIAPAV